MPRKNQYQWSENPDTDDMPPSRSQKKRDSTALQKLGETLTTLSSSALAALPLNDDLRGAIRDWHAMSSHESRRRQLQYIGRLMREGADTEAIQNALTEQQEAHSIDTALQHRVEQAREALLAAPLDSLPELAANYGEHAEKIVDLARRAQNERANGRPPQAGRALFRLLREYLQA